MPIAKKRYEIREPAWGNEAKLLGGLADQGH